MTSLLEFENDNDDSKQYKIEVVCNSTVYVRGLEDYLLGFYYLIFYNGYPEKKNI